MIGVAVGVEDLGVGATGMSVFAAVTHAMQQNTHKTKMKFEISEVVEVVVVVVAAAVVVALALIRETVVALVIVVVDGEGSGECAVGKRPTTQKQGIQSIQTILRSQAAKPSAHV